MMRTLFAALAFVAPVAFAFYLLSLTPLRLAHAGTLVRQRSGIASCYGTEHGQTRTATGEHYDPIRLTAAHRSLSFGTRLRVTNLKTGRIVIVRINDRGPFIRGRVLDLSLGACRAIGNSGLAPVSFEAE